MIRPVRASDRVWLLHMGHSAGEADRILGTHPSVKHRPALITRVWQDEDGSVAGSASAAPIPEVTGLWLSGLVRVAGEAQGRGIGTALVRATLEAAQASGASRVQCFVEPDNGASIRAHERAGYSRAPAEQSYLIRASATLSPEPADEVPELEEVDWKTFQDAAIANGYGPSLEYFPRLRAPANVSTFRRVRSVGASAMRWLLRRPRERRFIVRGANRGFAGLILTTPGEPRLMGERDHMDRLTPHRLAALERIVEAPYWPDDELSGFLLLHDASSRPEPELVRKTLASFVA